MVITYLVCTMRCVRYGGLRYLEGKERKEKEPQSDAIYPTFGIIYIAS